MVFGLYTCLNVSGNISSTLENDKLANNELQCRQRDRPIDYKKKLSVSCLVNQTFVFMNILI